MNDFIIFQYSEGELNEQEEGGENSSIPTLDEVSNDENDVDDETLMADNDVENSPSLSTSTSSSSILVTLQEASSAFLDGSSITTPDQILAASANSRGNLDANLIYDLDTLTDHFGAIASVPTNESSSAQGDEIMLMQLLEMQSRNSSSSDHRRPWIKPYFGSKQKSVRMIRKPPRLPIASRSVLDTLQLDMATLLRSNLPTASSGHNNLDLSSNIPVPDTDLPSMHQLNNIIPPTRSKYNSFYTLFS